MVNGSWQMTIGLCLLWQFIWDLLHALRVLHGLGDFQIFHHEALEEHEGV
jgi:hypothetical protein